MEISCHSCQIPVTQPPHNVSHQYSKNSVCKKCLSTNFSESLSKLASIDRTPIKCPVTKCGHRMCITGILTHFITEECIPVDFIDVQPNSNPIELAFCAASLPTDGSYCIGGLLYGSPIVRELSLPNNVHNIRYEKYRNHLPILIMAAKSDLKTVLLQENATVNDDEILIFWMVSPQTSVPVFVEIVASKGRFMKGATFNVRDVREEQTLEEFLHDNSNYLYLTKGEMNNLEDREGKIWLKIKIFVLND